VDFTVFAFVGLSYVPKNVSKIIGKIKLQCRTFNTITLIEKGKAAVSELYVTHPMFY